MLFRSSSLGNTRSTTRHDHHAVTRRVSRDVAPEPPLCGTFRTGSKSRHLAWCVRRRNTATCASPVTTCWRSAGGGVCRSAISPPGSGQLLPASLRSVRHARARLPRRFRAGWHNCDRRSQGRLHGIGGEDRAVMPGGLGVHDVELRERAGRPGSTAFATLCRPPRAELRPTPNRVPVFALEWASRHGSGRPDDGRRRRAA